MGKSNNKNPEPDLEKEFEEEINKPYYKVDYFDGFKLPYEKLNVSIIIPTYNRCPYKPGTLRAELNPLAWAIESSILQKPKINEIIIVDDNSEDYTEEVVNSIREKIENLGIKLIYLKNKKNKGNAISRDMGSKAANSKFLFFSDDDCIIPPYCILGAVYTFEKLAERGINIAAINLPTYFRKSMPKTFIQKKEIGRIDFLRGQYTTNKDLFPQEYLNGLGEKKFMNVELHILEPIPITNFNTFALCSKKAFQDVGGFKKSLIKRGIDREFGCRLIENGYEIYFQPDPKFHCVHGSYGLKTGDNFEGDDWFRRVGGKISIKKAMEECDKPGEKTGMRINQKDYLMQAIISFFVLIYPRNKKGALKWMEKVYDAFVKKGDTSIFGGAKLELPSEKERKDMWKKAIKQSLFYLKKKEINEIEKVEKIFKKLQSKKSNFEDALKMMSEV